MQNPDSRCPRCGEGHLRSWAKLAADEREVVLRLPGSADYSRDARQARHRWCTRCWFEDRDETPINV